MQTCFFENATIVFLVATLTISGTCQAQFDIDSEPILYSSTEPEDAVWRLARKLDDETVQLEWDGRHGWLPSLLDHLEIASESQTLVFSKTSLQFRRITPSQPRALYFNDQIYVGSIRGSDLIEIAAVDPQQGAMFYTMSQDRKSAPIIRRDEHGECMACHNSGRTQQVPGFLVRSVYTRIDGQPELRLGSITTDHTTPLENRYGGWYVTGQHGRARHRGNVVISSQTDDPIDRDEGANRMQLPDRVSPDSLLEPTSDIVALMLLEHQSQMHNYVARASYETRRALHHQENMNRILDRPADYQSESTQRRIASSAEDVVRYALFCDEYELESPVSGRQDFVESFQAIGKRDARGRSLRDLDLNHRLLRYPCSYLIYSEAFLSLPDLVLQRIKQRMDEVLSGEDDSEFFQHLSAEDRRNIREILTETHPLFQNS